MGQVLMGARCSAPLCSPNIVVQLCQKRCPSGVMSESLASNNAFLEQFIYFPRAGFTYCNPTRIFANFCRLPRRLRLRPIVCSQRLLNKINNIARESRGAEQRIPSSVCERVRTGFVDRKMGCSTRDDACARTMEIHNHTHEHIQCCRDITSSSLPGVDSRRPPPLRLFY